VPDLPDESWVSHIEASRADAGRAYATVDRHRSDDPGTRVYRTDDFGEHWESIAADFPPNHYAHVVREDPRNPDVLYLGTELGIWTSLDRGESWSSLRLNLPPVAVRDIKVHERENDIVIATHGRSLWVLDDATVLQELASAQGRTAHAFTPRTATRFMAWAKRFSFDIGDRIFIGDNPPYGAMLSYYLSEEAVGAIAGEEDVDSAEITIRITDADGELVRRLEAPARMGVNRTAWDLRHGLETDEEAEGDSPFSRAPQGPLVVPGRYAAHFHVGADTLTVAVEVRLDPRHDVPFADLVAQRDAILALTELGQRITEAVEGLDAAKDQIDGLVERLKDEDDGEEIVEELEALADSIAELKGELTSSGGGRGLGGGRATVQSDLRRVSGGMASATARPTDAQTEWADRLSARAEELLRDAEELTGARMDQLNTRLQEAGVRLIGRSR